MKYKQFKVWVDTEEELDALLNTLEDDGYGWSAGRVKPTNWKPTPSYSIGIFAYCDGDITFQSGYDYFKKHRFKEVNLYEYLDKPAFDIPNFENQFIDMICGM